MPRIIKPDDINDGPIPDLPEAALNPASLACIDLLMQVLADAKKGNVTSVAIIACGAGDFGANIAGPNALAMNLGLDVLKAKIVSGVTQPPGMRSPHAPSILTPRPVPGRRN